MARHEPAWLRYLLLSLSFVFLAIFLLIPLVTVFGTALGKGVAYAMSSIVDATTQAAIRLTLLTTLVVLPLNLVFGVVAAWTLTKFEFRGKQLLLTLIDLPFSVSPVISGLIFILLFGAQGLFGAWLLEHDVQIVFAVPGIILATLFITFPYVARELIPLMQAQGSDQEEAALTLGASGWQTFFSITLPNIRWGLIYGVILLNARAMGEFGAVSVVSGHIRGLTNTVPLHVEILYNEYNLAGAFAVASLLALVAIATLIAKIVVKWKLLQQGTLVLSDSELEELA